MKYLAEYQHSCGFHGFCRTDSVAQVIAAIATAPRSVQNRHASNRCAPPAAAIKLAGAVVIRMLNGNIATEPGKRK